METIEIFVRRDDVYSEVGKATDYTGSKMLHADAGARDRVLASDDDLRTLSRFWDESALIVNERLKSMLVGGTSSGDGYRAVIEVSRSFDRTLTPSVESAVRGFFIASVIGQWFKLANKSEAADYVATAAEMITGAERLLYSRRKPTIPKD